MSTCQRVVRPAIQSINNHHHRNGLLRQTSTSRGITRACACAFFSTSSARKDEEAPPPPPPPSTTTATPNPSSSSSGPATTTTTTTTAQTKMRMQDRLMDRDTTTVSWAERKLMRAGTPPIGSRRRRAAIRTSQNVPFDQLPYQCFQEARKILQEDRHEKLQLIARQMRTIDMIEARPAEEFKGGQAKKDLRLKSLRASIEKLTILADINDPIVKRRFEDGQGNMAKPIYRHLAEEKWRGLPYRVIKQRIESFFLVPDVLPKFEPLVDLQLYFRRSHVEPGEIIESLVSEVPPRLKVQFFSEGQRHVSVAVVDLDVPNAETDSFDRRCHFLAANVPIGPEDPSLPLSKLNKETQVAVPWLPAFSQKGAPYHRLVVLVLEQEKDALLDLAKLRELYSGRDGFSLKSFRDKFNLTPVGMNLFRTVWDDHTETVMQRAGVPGADIEFKHKRVYSLKGPKKARGWEAKRSKPKYKTLWKYSKNIYGLKKRR